MKLTSFLNSNRRVAVAVHFLLDDKTYCNLAMPMEKTSDPSRESPWSQSVDLLLEATMQSNNEHILKRLEHFRTKYEQMLLELENSMRKMDRSLDYTNNLLRLDLMNQYKEKSDLAKENMARVSHRILTIQHRLNNMRKAIPSKKLSLVERGPFRYRCLVSEGVRHREYPSIRARNIPLQAVGKGNGTGGTTSDGTVLFNDIVEISERVSCISCKYAYHIVD